MGQILMDLRYRPGDMGVVVEKPDFKYVRASELKVTELYPSAGDALHNSTGVEFILFPKGQRGLRVTFEDGSTKLYWVKPSGKVCEVRDYNGQQLENDFGRKFERFFGMSDKIRLKNDTIVINLFHAGIFLALTALIGGLAAIGAWFIHSASI